MIDLGYQQTPIPDGDGLPQMHVHAIMKGQKLKEAFTITLKMIFVDHHFRLHQTRKNIKYFTLKQTEHIIKVKKIKIDNACFRESQVAL